jgi:hypothetical protein
VKCGERKGKRACPALGEEICPQCCADGRLETIPCPQTCPHLESELYQNRRRKEKAHSRGKPFLEDLNARFQRPEARDFAFKVQADLYYFLRESPADDATVAGALDSARNSLSKIYVPEGAPHPLARFLVERLQDRRRYPPGPAFGTEDQIRVLTSLAASARSLGGEGSHKYVESVSSFFGELNFEADLDYSPEDAAAVAEHGGKEHRSPSGLILPRPFKG